MEKRKTTLSIRKAIFLMFVIGLFLSVFCYGTVVFINWVNAEKRAAERMAANINDGIYNQVYSYIQIPYHNNGLNHAIIENGMLDLSDEKQRERYFVEILKGYSTEIYSVGFGTSDGEYYGARRNEAGVVEIMRNNAFTGGNSWYYSVNEDLTAGDLVVQAGKFDPRTRAWYKAAVEAGDTVFSPVYKHFVMDDLSVSAAGPVYDEAGNLEGVLATHFLLSDIGKYLKDAVDEYNGMAFIIEKESNDLIANSIGVKNFVVLQDGTLQRFKLEDIKNIDIQNAYEQFKTNQESQQIFKGENDNFYVNTREIKINGIDWIVISALPESTIMADVYRSMLWSGFIAALFVMICILIFDLIMKKYLKPMKRLLQVSGEFSDGNLTKRVEIVRDDELGQISGSFNRVADKMQTLIDHLETNVKARTKELEVANFNLEANKDELRLVLDSSAEAIYGIDLEGKCTFCNRSCIEMLGYGDESELLGKNMHRQIHHTRKDGTPFPADECKILRAYVKGEGSHVDNEVFWRADGSSFDVEYSSYPQIRNGNIVGAAITFMDISERKRKEVEIQYLSCYDILTGLHNRRCFEENRAKIDKPENLPLSVIFGDINGLKMTNDIFGHTAGDELIKKSADILKQACRQSDIVARVGGDEFIMLLPNTTREIAEEIFARIKLEFQNAHVEAIKCSISLGLDLKHHPGQSLDEVMANAENAMYKDKMSNRISNNKEIIDTIIETLHAQYPREKQHSITVSKLCAEVGMTLHLPETEISKLERAGYLHDIGKIVLGESILNKEILSDEELEIVRQHSIVGYRILNLFDDTLDLAEYIYGHHERWDGNGYPRGLKGEQIPQISRIIAVVETYERALNRGNLSYEERKSTALNIIKQCAGTQFDPQIAELFVQLIHNSKGV